MRARSAGPFFFPRCSQLLLHPGARGCDNYQNVYYVSLLIMQKPRQSPVRKRGHHTQGLGSGEGSSLPPGGGAAGPCSPTPSPPPLPGWPRCRARLCPPRRRRVHLLLSVSGPLETRTELPPFRGVCLPHPSTSGLRSAQPGGLPEDSTCHPHSIVLLTLCTEGRV